MSKKNNYTDKTIFTWFGNLPTFIELQESHYYQGKIQSVVVQGFFFFFSLSLSQKLQRQTLITKVTFSTSCAQDSQWAPWTKSQKISH